MHRIATVHRKTKETNVSVTVDLDGDGTASITTGVGFLDHLLETLGKHSRVDIDLQCTGDLEVDDHHTAEDCALALGAALNEALDDKSGIHRFGFAYAPLDEALARAVIDLSGRPSPVITLALKRAALGGLASENIHHVLSSLSVALKASLHVDVLRGFNDHHKAEAAFKALALALRQAIALDGSGVPSTKGVL